MAFRANSVEPNKLQHPSKGTELQDSTSTSPSVSNVDIHPARKRKSNLIEELKETIDTTLDDAEHLEGSNALYGDQICICPRDPKIPRPRNAFILYRSHHCSQVTAQNPHINNPDISILIGKQWQSEPPEVKKIWKAAADEEKQRHQKQFPGYKYQPKRSARRSSLLETIESTTPTICPKCGKRSMNSPSTPLTPSQPRLFLPPPLSSTAPTTNMESNQRQLPSMNTLRLGQPASGPRSSRSIPCTINMSHRSIEIGDGDRMLSPETKRRRYTNGGAFVPIVDGQPQPLKPRDTPYSMPPPSRQSFSHMDDHFLRFTPPNSAGTSAHPGMALPSRPGGLTPSDRDLTLPPLQAITHSRGMETMMRSMPFLAKIRVLGRISPPWTPARPPKPQPVVRGAVIAVEGDDQSAVAEVTTWLENFLNRGEEYRVTVAQGPRVPRDISKPATVPEYYSLISEWHHKSREIVDLITTPILLGNDKNDGECSPHSRQDGPRPVLLLQRYQLYASDAFAARIPIKDMYSRSDHWQWMATLWRDHVGPDVVVYVGDLAATELAKQSKMVEVVEELRTVIVKRGSGLGNDRCRVDEGTKRRLGFEIGEIIRNVGVQVERKAARTD